MSVHEDMNPSARQAPGPEAERWLMRLRSSDCGAAERARFEDWRRADVANANAFAAAEHCWRRAAELDRDPELLAVADAALARGKRRRTLRRDWGDRLPVLAATAAVVVAAVGVVAYGYRSGWFAPAPKIYATEVGERRNIALEDGSTLVLNTDTTVEVRYRGDARRVVLTRGEAQFDVQHDVRRPFSVTAGGTAVTALGTRFQVRAGENATVVTLLEGRVQVAAPGAPHTGTSDASAARSSEYGAGRTVELGPGERLWVRRGAAAWQREAIDPAIAVGWTEGRLVFRALPLLQAVEELNRYTPRKIRVADRTLDEIRVNGVFDTGDTESVIAALRFAYPLRVDHVSSTEIILRRSQPPPSK